MGVPPCGIWMGLTHHPGLDRGTSPHVGLDGVLAPFVWDLDDTWTGYATGSTPLAVSRRRTFLFLKFLHVVGEENFIDAL